MHFDISPERVEAHPNGTRVVYTDRRVTEIAGPGLEKLGIPPAVIETAREQAPPYELFLYPQEDRVPPMNVVIVGGPGNANPYIDGLLTTQMVLGLEGITNFGHVGMPVKPGPYNQWMAWGIGVMEGVQATADPKPEHLTLYAGDRIVREALRHIALRKKLLLPIEE